MVLACLSSFSLNLFYLQSLFHALDRPLPRAGTGGQVNSGGSSGCAFCLWGREKKATVG